MNEYHVEISKTVGRPWINKKPIRLGDVPRGLGTPDHYARSHGTKSHTFSCVCMEVNPILLKRGSGTDGSSSGLDVSFTSSRQRCLTDRLFGRADIFVRYIHLTPVCWQLLSIMFCVLIKILNSSGSQKKSAWMV